MKRRIPVRQVLESCQWHSDRMLLNDVVFRLEHFKNENWPADLPHFMFFKIKALVDQYLDYFGRHPVEAENVLELGMWDGGSAAFWFDVFQPGKLVSIDLADREDSEYFNDFVARRDARSRLSTHWRTDQSDAAKLRALVAREFSGPLDLVIDDASHLYTPTRASFEILFPLLRPGGVYIVEDWAWGHWGIVTSAAHPWAKETPPTRFVQQLVELTGSQPNLVADLAVYQGFVALRRGAQMLSDAVDFDVERFVVRTPQFHSAD